MVVYNFINNIKFIALISHFIRIELNKICIKGYINNSQDLLQDPY